MSFGDGAKKTLQRDRTRIKSKTETETESERQRLREKTVIPDQVKTDGLYSDLESHSRAYTYSRTLGHGSPAE